MIKTGYYVIGGQYSPKCYGHCATLDEARKLAETHEEYWLNCHGYHIPAVYNAKDCEMDTRAYGALKNRIVPKMNAKPVPCQETKCEFFSQLVKKITRTDNTSFQERRVWDFEFILTNGESVVIQLWDSYTSSRVCIAEAVAEPHNNSIVLYLAEVPMSVLLELFAKLYPIHPDSAHPGWMVRYYEWPFPENIRPYQAVPQSVEEAAMLSIFGTEEGAEINDENRWADTHKLFGCKTRRMVFELCRELTKPGESPFRWDSHKVIHEENSLHGKYYLLAFTKDGETRFAEVPIARSTELDPYYMYSRPMVLTDTEILKKIM